MGLSITEPDLVAIGAGLILGLGGIPLGWAFTTGRYRAPARHYWNPDVPWYIRNNPFAAFPFGAMFICAVGLGVVQYLPASYHVVAIGMLSVGLLGSFLLGISWMRRPPRSLKPYWLRSEESQRPAPGLARGALGVFDRVLATLFVSITVAVLGIIVLATALALLDQVIGN
jgi:hypothetical protein